MASVTDVGVDIVGLTEVYAKGSIAKALLDYFSTRQKNSVETKTDRVLALLHQMGHRVGRAEVIAFFRALESCGCGEYIEGRHGRPSRFHRKVEMVSVGRAAAGSTPSVPTIEAPTDDDDYEEGAMLPHDFRLRPELIVRFELPADLSAAEASRIAEFVKALPFA